MAVLALAVGSIACTVRAEWINTGWPSSAGQDSVYTNPANWAGGVVDHVFSGAILGGAARTIQLPDTAYAIPASGLTLSYTDNAKLTFIPEPFGTRTLTLSGNISVDVATTTTSQTVDFGTASRFINIDLNGGSRTINVTSTGPTQWTNFDTLNVYGDISNGTLIKDGWGALNVQRPLTVSTPIDFRKGTIQLTGSGSVSTSTEFQGMWSRMIVDSSATTDRLGDSNPLIFRGGALMIRNATAGSTITEAAGPVTIESGKAYIGIDRDVNASATTTLSLSDLTRQNSASLSVGGSATLGGVNKVVVTGSAGNALLANSLIGGGGSAGSTNISIVPWAAFAATNPGQQDSSWYSNGTNGTGAARVGGWVTYDSTNGFRPLNTTTEYAQSFATAAATDNLRLDGTVVAPSITADQTINSLFLDGTAQNINLDGNTLTVTSGAIGTGATSWQINNGTLNFGSNPGIFSGRSNNDIGAVIAGTGGVIIDNVGGGVRFNATNVYTGDTIVHGSLVTLNGSDRIPDASHVQTSKDGTLVIAGDGQVRNEVVASLGGRGIVRWGSGSARSSLRLGDGQDITTGAVIVGSFIAPGDSEGAMRAGALTLGSAATSQIDVIFQPGSSLRIDLLSSDQFDTLALAKGAAIINGGTLELSFLDGYVPGIGETYHIITTTLGTTGTFTSVTSNLPGVTFSQETSGNDLVLTVVPEPTIAGLLSITAGLALVRRRRA